MSDHPLGAAASEPFGHLRHLSIAIPISDPGYFDPASGMSEADQVEADQRHADRLNREAAQRKQYAARRESATGATLRRVFDLHAPVEQYGDWFQCGSCYDGGNMGDHEDWPCPTARILLGEPDA